MKCFTLLLIFGLAQLCRGGWEGKDLTQKELSLSHNYELMDYMVKNSEDIFETIMKNGPGSTELLSQVAGVLLTSTTQAWYRCSKKYDVNREVFTHNIMRYTAYKNDKELCAKACFMEESKMVTNGELDADMVSLVMIMGYGDDQDIHNYSKELVKHCNRQLSTASNQSCKSAAYLDCYMKGLAKGNIYMPAQILHEFSNPWVMEMASRK